MRSVSAPEQLQQDVQRLIDNVRGDLDRIELLIVALCAFERSVPEYEPRFHHTQDLLRNVHELRR